MDKTYDVKVTFTFHVEAPDEMVAIEQVIQMDWDDESQYDIHIDDDVVQSK